VCHSRLSEPRQHAPITDGHAACMKCHEHAQQYADAQCNTCHVDLVAYPLVPVTQVSHQGDFLRRHASLARSSQAACGSCHDQNFCMDCHAKTTMVPVETKLVDRPDRRFIHQVDFVGRHSVDARADPASCQRCHSISSCENLPRARARLSGNQLAQSTSAGLGPAGLGRLPRRRRAAQHPELRGLPRPGRRLELRELPQGGRDRRQSASLGLPLAPQPLGGPERRPLPRLPLLENPERQEGPERRSFLPRSLSIRSAVTAARPAMPPAASDMHKPRTRRHGCPSMSTRRFVKLAAGRPRWSAPVRALLPGRPPHVARVLSKIPESRPSLGDTLRNAACPSLSRSLGDTLRNAACQVCRGAPRGVSGNT